MIPVYVHFTAQIKHGIHYPSVKRLYYADKIYDSTINQSYFLPFGESATPLKGLSSVAKLLLYSFIWTSQLQSRKWVLTEEKPISGRSSCDVHMPHPHVAIIYIRRHVSPPRWSSALMLCLCGCVSECLYCSKDSQARKSRRGIIACRCNGTHLSPSFPSFPYRRRLNLFRRDFSCDYAMHTSLTHIRDILDARSESGNLVYP